MSNERDIEVALDNLAHIQDNTIENIRYRANNLPNDGEGECDWCGVFFTRLVNKACGKCRDLYKLK